MTTRAILALRQIMLDASETMPIRRRIEAAEQLLDYEAPPEIVEEAKAFLMSVAEAEDTLVDFRLDALKLLRKAEARKVVPARAAVRDDPRRIELLSCAGNCAAQAGAARGRCVSIPGGLRR